MSEKRAAWSSIIWGSLLLATAIMAWTALKHAESKERESRKALADLQEAHELLASYKESLSQSDTALVLLDEKGIIKEWSQGATDIFGWTREEAIGYGVGFIVPDSARKQHREAFDRAMLLRKKGIVQQVECSAHTKDRGMVSVMIRIRTFEEKGEMRTMATILKKDRVHKVVQDDG